MTELIVGNNQEIVTSEVTRIITDTYKFQSTEDPDVHMLNGYDIGTLGVETIRVFCRELQKKPFRAKQQLGIILGFEFCTIEAQNALLKELEDHTVSTHYILGTADETALLATIKSRVKTRYVSATLTKKNSKNIEELAEQFFTPSADVVALYAKITSKEWTKQEAESLLAVLFEHQRNSPQAKQFLVLLQKSSEFLASNITPKQVLIFLLFGIRKMKLNES